MVLETNLIHKLTADLFVHISLPPREPIPESRLLEPVEVLVKDDASVHCWVQLEDLLRLTLGRLRNDHTLPSHGLTADDFRQWWMSRFPGSTLDTPLTVYYFRKISTEVPKYQHHG